MNFLLQLYQTVLFQPLLNGLVLLYVFLPGHDLGVAVVVLTLLIRLILHPVSVKGLKSQKALAYLQPKIKEIQEKFKNDRARQSSAMMELYRKEKISPASGCLPLLLQLPVIIALYQVFLKGMDSRFLADNLYGFVSNPGVISSTFLGVFDLQNKIFVLVVAVLAGLAQFWQAKVSGSPAAARPAAGDIASMLQKQMLYIFPVLTVFIIYKVGGLIGVYWLSSTLISVGEQYLANRRLDTARPVGNKN
ncbi:MAG: YidC/Oxa1 family membrane protein insertase [Candidatus Pacebacteria bacterium]|nr:YidC/Oxa1 family membrane protein insertase [Candidatus Paceibacterota bacterium]